MSAYRITLIRPEDPPYRRVLELRDRMLRRPLGLSLFKEDLSAEAGQLTLAAWHEDELIGCVMLQPQPDSWQKLRQMAVTDKWQRKGVGRSLVDAAELTALEMGAEGIRLHARLSAVGFYEQCGYEAVGEIFEEVGIPHLLMQKSIL